MTSSLAHGGVGQRCHDAVPAVGMHVTSPPATRSQETHGPAAFQVLSVNARTVFNGTSGSAEAAKDAPLEADGQMQETPVTATSVEPEGEREALVEWFESSFGEASRTARLLWSARDQLDGGLTAGQASGNGVFVAFALKHEIRAGLLQHLERFVEDHLTTEWIQRAPSLAPVEEAITAMVEHLDEHADRLVRVQYGKHAPVPTHAMGLAGHAAGALQDVIHTCVADLVAGQR